MFLRPDHRGKDGKDHTYWSLVETVRTRDGPRQQTLCYLGELNSSAEARWVTTVEVFNQQGETQQLKLFPSHVEPPADDPQVARVLLNKVRLERTRQFGACFLGLELSGYQPELQLEPPAERGLHQRSGSDESAGTATGRTEAFHASRDPSREQRRA